MAQFKTTRMSDLTPVADVDDHVLALEAAIVYAFGLPTGAELTGRVFPGTDVGGNITGIIRSAAAANPAGNAGPGWRSRDTTTGDEFLIMATDGYLRVYKNTGTQASPVWTERNALDLSDGKWSVGAETGVFTGCMVSDILNDTQDMRSGGYIQWKNEVYDDTNYFSAASPTRITIPTTGRYRMHWSVFVGSEPLKHFTNVALYIGLRQSGSSWVFDANRGSGMKWEIDTAHPGVGINGQWAGQFTAGAYFELYAYTEGGDDYTGNVHSGHFIIERVS
jgi:hypothetical protein